LILLNFRSLLFLVTIEWVRSMVIYRHCSVHEIAYTKKQIYKNIARE